MNYLASSPIATGRRIAAKSLFVSLLFSAACVMEPELDSEHDPAAYDELDSVAIAAPVDELTDSWQLAALASDSESASKPDAATQDFIVLSTAKYSALFRQSSSTHRTVINVDWSTFSSTWQQYSNEGYRLVDIDTAIDAGTRRYTGVFQPGTDGHALWVGASWSSFSAKWEELSNQGLRLVDFETYMEGSERVYTGVWRSGSYGHYLWVNVDWTSFSNKWTELAGQGLRLIDIEVWEDNDQLRYAGVWRSGTDGYALWVGASWNNFADKWMELNAQGLRLIDMEAYTFGDRRLYAGVYRAGTGVYDLIGTSSKSVLEQKIASLAAEGKQPVAMEYEFGQDMPPPGMAAAFHDVVENHAVGYSFAVVESDVITSAGGFGYARAPWEASSPGVAMTGTKRSHIASVSKPITAVAIMNLLEANPNITLDTPFVNIIGNRLPPVASGVQNVTLRNLLQHRSGMVDWGSCGPNFDTSMDSLVTQPMATTIGTYNYSNGNFCLLRMVVEALSGTDYVTYVRNNILSPMGISGMSCTPDASQPTLYYKYNANSGAGYFWSTDYNSECGAYGWYASATDLARFLIGVRKNTVLTSTSTSTMLSNRLGWFTATTDAGTGYHHNGAWYTGDDRGYNGAIVRLPNNTEAVLLINTNGYIDGSDYFKTVGTLVDGFNRMLTY